MNWNEIRGRWTEFKGKAKETWGRLTHRDLEVIQGMRDQLVGKLQELYGMAKSEAEEQVSAFARRLKKTGRDVSRKARAKGRQALEKAEDLGRAAAGRALGAASSRLDRFRDKVERRGSRSRAAGRGRPSANSRRKRGRRG